MSLSRFDIVGPARRDLAQILRDSEIHFGAAARDRYEALIEQAIHDLISNPERPGVQTVKGYLRYHLRHSRNRVTSGRVRYPRHILVCRIQGDILVILAVGHDAMEEGLVARIEQGEGG